MRSEVRDRLPAYVVASLAFGLALLLTSCLWPLLEPSPFSLFFAAVMVSAWCGGRGPGLLTTALSALACDYYFIRPLGRFGGHAGDLVRVGVFVVGALLITALADARRRAAAAEQRQRRWLERTLSGISDAVIATGPDGRVSFLNGVAQGLTGRTRALADGRPIREVFPILDGANRTPAECPVARAMRVGGAVELAEPTFLAAGGGRALLIEGSAAPIQDDAGRAVGAVVVFRDVTDRRRAEEEQARLAAHVRLLMESTGEGLFGIDREGLCTFVNRAAAETLGYEPDELIGRNTHELIHHSRGDGSPYPAAECPIRRAFLDGRGNRVEGELFWRRDGTSFPAEYSSYPVLDGDAVAGAVVTFNDVTERARSAEELRQAHDGMEQRVRERTAELSAANRRLEAEVTQRTNAEAALRDLNRERGELLRRLVASQEEERHRIARELHDQMGQHLAAFLLGLKALRSQCHGRPPAAVSLQKLQDLANKMGEEVHRIALELRPTALDDWGLETALTHYVGEWSRRSRVMAQVHCAGIDRRRLPAPVEIALYRIAQESLTNVMKHARADRVSLILDRRPDHVLAIVEDNGRGFDAGAVLREPDARRRLGLLGMQERVAQAGGTLEFESSPGCGTSLFIRIPLDEDGGAAGHD